jgi:murein DD-endopeptidase MepM/ murein hydrolase activator NlpD
MTGESGPENSPAGALLNMRFGGHQLTLEKVPTFFSHWATGLHPSDVNPHRNMKTTYRTQVITILTCGILTLFSSSATGASRKDKVQKIANLGIENLAVVLNKAGTNAALRFKVKNSGNKDAGNFYVRIDLDGLKCSEFRMNSLRTGRAHDVSRQIRVPKVTGGRNVRVTVDSKAAVSESNEADNVGLLTLSPLKTLLKDPLKTPDFKLPVPGGKAWYFTVKAGGESYDGVLDTNHTGKNFYSLDISARTIENNGSPESSVPILASADGIVADVSPAEDTYNGWYVTIDHPTAKGTYQTRYLHLAERSLLQKGNTVHQGDVIGTMGDTGIGKGIHLHFGFRWNGAGYEKTPELEAVMLEGRKLTNFQHSEYYSSTNLKH